MVEMIILTTLVSMLAQYCSALHMIWVISFFSLRLHVFISEMKSIISSWKDGLIFLPEHLHWTGNKTAVISVEINPQYKSNSRHENKNLIAMVILQWYWWYQPLLVSLSQCMIFLAFFVPKWNEMEYHRVNFPDYPDVYENLFLVLTIWTMVGT